MKLVNKSFVSNELSTTLFKLLRKFNICFNESFRFISWQQLSNASFAVAERLETSINFSQLYLPTRSLCTLCVVQTYWYSEGSLQIWRRKVTSNSKDTKTETIKRKKRLFWGRGKGGGGVNSRILPFWKSVSSMTWSKLWVNLVVSLHNRTKKEMKSSQNFLSKL